MAAGHRLTQYLPVAPHPKHVHTDSCTAAGFASSGRKVYLPLQIFQAGRTLFSLFLELPPELPFESPVLDRLLVLLSVFFLRSLRRLGLSFAIQAVSALRFSLSGETSELDIECLDSIFSA